MTFAGFPPEGVEFLSKLEKNNHRDWFNQNKSTYKDSLQAPAKLFIAELADRLGESFEGKLFRIHRDLRFSKDKTPFNCHLRIAFTAQARCSYFFSLEPDRLTLGAGLFAFDKVQLQDYRQRLSDDGCELAGILDALTGKGFRLNEPELKKVPRGFEASPENERLIRHKGLSLFLDSDIPAALHTARAVDHCLQVFQQLQPFCAWLDRVIGVAHAV